MTETELKYNLFQIIDKINDSSALKTLYAQLSKYKVEEESDWWHNLTDEQKQDVEIGLQEADRGEFISNEEVIAKTNKLLGRA